MMVERMAADQLAKELDRIGEASRMAPIYLRRMAEAGASAVINPRGRLVVGTAGVVNAGTGEINVLIEEVPDDVALLCASLDMMETASNAVRAYAATEARYES